jgi:hypothetical protein
MKDKTENAAALDAGLSTLDSRRHRLVYLLTAPFLLSVIGAWAWLNTDILRPDTQLSTQDSQPRVWLTAMTNIPAYVFNDNELLGARDVESLLIASHCPTKNTACFLHLTAVWSSA